MSGQPEIVTLEPTPTAAVRGTVTMDGLREFYDSSFGKVAAAAARQGATPTAAYGLYEPPRVWWRVLISTGEWSHACTKEVQRRAA